MSQTEINSRASLYFYRAIALAITFCTGFTGLVYEVSWHLYLSNLLGSQAQAAAVILAIFLGGLAVGYWVFGKVSNSASPAKAVSVVGWIEVGIGLWVLLFPSLYMLLWTNNEFFFQEGLSGDVLDILVCIGLIGFPTVLMGGTLPLLTQGLSKDLEDAPVFHAYVYAINTGGAFAGCLASGFIMIPVLGLSGTMYYTAPVNIIAGIGLLVLSRFLSTTEVSENSEQIEEKPSLHHTISIRTGTVVAFLAGFYSLCLQVVFMRAMGLAAGASKFTFSMVVAVFILALAVGAWKIAGRKGAVLPLWVNQIIAFTSALAVYVTVDSWGYYNHVIRTLFTNYEPSFYVYYGTVFIILCLLLFIPVGAMGATMPLLFGSIKNEKERLGANVGRLYGWNTTGCVIGALFGGYYLLYLIDLDTLYLICLGCMLFSVVLVFPWRSSAPQSRMLRPMGAMIIATGTTLLLIVAPWNHVRMGIGLFRFHSPDRMSYAGPEKYYQAVLSPRKMLAYEDGPNTTVAVVAVRRRNQKDEKPDKPWPRALYVNGKSDGYTSGSDVQTMVLAAHLPALLKKGPIENVGVIGFGLGYSSGSIARYPEVKRIEQIEISPVVKKYAHLFSFANGSVIEDPRFSWHIDDAYRVLSASPRTYDIIVSEPSNPWVAGVERVFAREFYEIVRKKMTPEGIYAQWFHEYSISLPTVGMVVRTFGEVFPNVRIFKFGPDILLLGSGERMDTDNIEAMEERWASHEAVREELKPLGVETIEGMLAFELPVSTKTFRASPVHSLEFPKLSHAAGIDFFRNSYADLNESFYDARIRPWVSRVAADLLIGHYIRTKNNRLDILKRYTKASCEVEKLDISLLFDKNKLQCVMGFRALSVLNEIEGTTALNETDRELLMRSLSSNEKEGDDEMLLAVAQHLTVEDANAFMELFDKMNSPFLPISLKRLTYATIPCMKASTAEAYKCRIRLVEVLAQSGHGAVANRVFNETLSEVSEKVLSSGKKSRIEKILREAVEAEKWYPGTIN